MTIEGPRFTGDPDKLERAIADELDHLRRTRANPPRSTMPDNPPTKATTIAATILCAGFALMLTLIGIAAIIWAL
jgi:hypothetical protein